MRAAQGPVGLGSVQAPSGAAVCQRGAAHRATSTEASQLWSRTFAIQTSAEGAQLTKLTWTE